MEETQPFIGSSGSPNLERKFPYQSSQRFSFGSRRVALVLTVLLVLSNSIWALLFYHRTSDDCVRPKLIYTPARPAIKYQRTTLNRSLENNPYTGPPRPELDQAWHDLVNPLTTKVSSEDLALLGEDSISLADGSGYVAEMAAFHELHCVKRIRQHLYLDVYHPNMTDKEREIEDTHIDHCLEYWREAAMCRGDPTMATYFWYRGVPKSRVHSQHECVDWDAFYSWADSRKVVISDLSVLTPPT